MNPKLLNSIITATVLSFSLFSSNNNLEAAELPWASSEYAHYSNQEPLRDLLEALSASQKTPIVVSERIDDVVSVYFKTNSAKKIFQDLVKTYNLSWYYDGDTLYVYTKEEMQTGSVALKYISPEDFSVSMRRLGILDDHFYWVASDIDKMIYFKGPERFVSSVLEMSRVLDKETAKKPEITGKIFKWVDRNGVVNFGSKLPQHLDKSRSSGNLENLGFEVVE